MDVVVDVDVMDIVSFSLRCVGAAGVDMGVDVFVVEDMAFCVGVG